MKVGIWLWLSASFMFSIKNLTFQQVVVVFSTDISRQIISEDVVVKSIMERKHQRALFNSYMALSSSTDKQWSIFVCTYHHRPVLKVLYRFLLSWPYSLLTWGLGTIQQGQYLIKRRGSLGTSTVDSHKESRLIPSYI